MPASIFTLFGSIFVDSSEAEKSISATEEKSNKLSESFINGIQNVGKWALGVAAAAGSAALAMGTAAINVSTDVDSAMNDFAASTGTAAEELGKYEDAMLNIYKNNFGESFEDIAASMGTIKQIMGEGMGAEELEAMTTNALMLRDTFEFDVSESVRAANSLMDQFGISGEEAYNLIAQGAQNGLNQNGDMLDTLNEYSVQFSQLGYDAEDMFNMLVNGAESGTWSIDKLGDAAKEFNIRMTDGTANDALKSLGLNVEEVNAKYAAGGDSAQGATQEIITALKGVEDENKRYLLGQQLMGTMWEDLGEDAIYALLDTQGEISNTKDALTEINEVKYDDLGSMVEGLKRNFETLLLPIGNALIPLIMEFVTLVQDNMPMIESIFAQSTPIIIGLFEGLLPPLLELVSALLPPLSQFINAVLSLLVPILSALLPLVTQILGTLLPPLVEWINLLLVPVTDIVNMILPILLQLLQPIIDMLQPIIALIQPIIEECIALIVPLMELLQKVLPPLIDVLTVLVNVVLAKVKNAFETLASVIRNVINVAVTYVKNQVDILQNIFNNVIGFIKNVFTGNWRAAFENVKNILSGIFQSMVNVVKTPVNAIIGVINGLVSGVVSGVNGVISALNKMKIDVPDWVTEKFGIDNFGFNIKKVTAPQIPYLAEGGTAIESGAAVVGESGAELIDLPSGAKVTPLTNNGDPIGYKEMAGKLDIMIELLTAILKKEGVVHIGGDEIVNYVNRELGALL